MRSTSATARTRRRSRPLPADVLGGTGADTLTTTGDADAIAGVDGGDGQRPASARPVSGGDATSDRHGARRRGGSTSIDRRRRGDDDLRVRDGLADTVRCGDGADRSTPTRFDDVALDCETVTRTADPAPPEAAARPAATDKRRRRSTPARVDRPARSAAAPSSASSRPRASAARSAPRASSTSPASRSRSRDRKTVGVGGGGAELTVKLYGPGAPRGGAGVAAQAARAWRGGGRRDRPRGQLRARPGAARSGSFASRHGLPRDRDVAGRVGDVEDQRRAHRPTLRNSRLSAVRVKSTNTYGAARAVERRLALGASTALTFSLRADRLAERQLGGRPSTPPSTGRPSACRRARRRGALQVAASLSVTFTFVRSGGRGRSCRGGGAERGPVYVSVSHASPMVAVGVGRSLLTGSGQLSARSQRAVVVVVRVAQVARGVAVIVRLLRVRDAPAVVLGVDVAVADLAVSRRQASPYLVPFVFAWPGFVIVRQLSCGVQDAVAVVVVLARVPAAVAVAVDLVRVRDPVAVVDAVGDAVVVEVVRRRVRVPRSRPGTSSPRRRAPARERNRSAQPRGTRRVRRGAPS